MRILYSHYLADDDHPAVLMVQAIASALRKLGHEVIVHRCSGPSEPGKKKSAGPTRRSLSSRARAKVWFARAVARNRRMISRDRRVLQDVRPDVVLARQDAYCLSMPWSCRALGVPMVTYADAPVAYETRLFGSESGRWHPPALVEAIEKWTLLSSQAAITVSHPAARRLSLYGLSTPIHVVPNGVDPSRFPVHTPSERAKSRASLGLFAPWVVGFVGSFKPFHGIDRLRDLILATADRDDIQWLLIGDGPERVGLEKALEGRHNTVFLGKRPSDEIGSLLGLVDVAVAPHALFDGDFYLCPLKVLEYAASGSAIVASDQGDIPLLLDHGKAGVLLSDNTIEIWKAAVCDLLQDSFRRGMLGAAARERALKTLTWDATATQVARILAEAIERADREQDQIEANLPHFERREASRQKPTRLISEQKLCTGTFKKPLTAFL